MPGIESYHWREILPEGDIKAGPSIIFTMDEFFRKNGTVKMYHEMDQFLADTEQKFDMVFTDNMAFGSVIAAKKHQIPVVAQYTGVVLETVADRPPWYQIREVAAENPNVATKTWLKNLQQHFSLFAGAALDLVSP